MLSEWVGPLFGSVRLLNVFISVYIQNGQVIIGLFIPPLCLENDKLRCLAKKTMDRRRILLPQVRNAWCAHSNQALIFIE